MRVAEDGKELARFEYHNNNQLAKVVRENGVETFEWAGLALIERNGTKYINEPHAGGGNPILAIVGDGQKTEAIFTDILGTSMGKVSGNGYSAIDKTSFGADSSDNSSFFTGKPYIEDLGYAFLFRNYRADMGKWLSQDPIGYPIGWNNFIYCSNNIISIIDYLGCLDINLFNQSDSLYLNANKIVTGGVSVAGHGNKNGLYDYRSDPQNGKYISPNELANMIKSAPGYNDKPVWLIGCNVGSGDYAQQVADILGTTVFAPTDLVWIYPNGTMIVAPRDPDNPNQPDMDNQKPWNATLPKGGGGSVAE